MKLNYPSTENNKGPILAVIGQYLEGEKRVLEVASGSGEHALFFTKNCKGLIWQPSECDPKGLASIAAYQKDLGNSRYLSPINLDICEDNHNLKDGFFDIVFNSNMVHISPKEAITGLLRLSSRTLKAGGLLILYGPFLENTVKTAQSNLAFDRSLKERNPLWGLRLLDNVIDEAKSFGFSLKGRHEMPSNNLTVIFKMKS